MAKKQKKQPAAIKDTVSKNKKYVVFFVILISILFLTLFQTQHQQTYQQHAATATCGAPGDTGNELGVGKYCTQGGGQCQGTGSSICSADIQLSGTGICSKACNTDADCGTGAVCYQDTLGKGCEPVACQTSPSPSQAPSSGVPSSGCLAAGGCPTQAVSQVPSPSGSTQPSTTPTATPTNNGSGGNIFQLFLQFFMLIVQFFANLFKGI